MQLPLAGEGEAVADGDDGEGDAGVFVDLFVEGADGLGVEVDIFGIGNAATPEDVIDDDEATGPGEEEATLVVAVEVFLVGVDEKEVEGVGVAVFEQGIEGLPCGCDVDLDFAFEPGFAPVAQGGLGMVLIDFAGDELAVERKGLGDAESAVAGEDANFERLLGIHELDDQTEKLAHFRRNLHLSVGTFGGFFAEGGEQFRFASGDGLVIFVKPVGEGQGGVGHKLSNTLRLKGVNGKAQSVGACFTLFSGRP